MITPDKRRKIRSDYVNRRMAATTIATIHKISASTVGRMKKAAKADGDDWDIARTATVIAGEGLDVVVSTVVEDFMILAQGLLEEVKDEQVSNEDKIKHLINLSDATVKMTAAAARLAPKISELGVAQSVVQQLLEFVRENFPHHSNAILEIIEPFGDQLTARLAP
ncbi:DUF1804 family protein [uncultured Tateyamaria sp.]|uniref:DUF1804 family protein n=1 Tax=uncultured Tateyamaria sp. TaxID=455651 RepID=UPI00260AB403|nr:DUF1804 family protein [uncultured Tateyamaria sp.]